MVGTFISDDASEVSLLRDALISQREEQAKITQAVLDRFKNLGKGTKIENNGAEMMTKLVIAQTSAVFKAIPEDTTDTAMVEWMDSNHAVLSAAPWDLDGVSIVEMKGVGLADSSKNYQARSTKLGMIMCQLLKDAKLTDCIKSLKERLKPMMVYY